MTLVLVSRYQDPRGRLVHRYHAPSSTTLGKVYVVDNLVGTDVWSCGPLSGEKKDLCQASRYKKTCRHIPNWKKPPTAAASMRSAEGVDATSGGSLPYSSDILPGQFDLGTTENILTLREMIETLSDESVTFRRWVIERKSGPMVVGLLARFFGFRILIPDNHSTESYLMSLPQFSTIRTASLDVLKAKQLAGAEGWGDDGSRQERHEAYRRFYSAERKGQMTLERATVAAVGR